MTDREILVKIGADIDELKKQLAEGKKQVKTFSKDMDVMGAAMKKIGTYAAGVFTVGAAFRFVTSSVEAANVQLQAVAGVEAALRSMGEGAGYTSQQLQEMASGLQRVSLFGDEQILRDVTQQMLTFGRVTGDEFRRAQQAALDLSTRLGGDLKGAAMQIGKALQDPVQGLTALRRAGVSFSDEQQDVIKRLNETGQAAEAQRIILAELEKQFGGAARAAAQVGTGPIKQLQMAVGDLSEEFGKELLPAINSVVLELNALAQSKEATDAVKDIGFFFSASAQGIMTAARALGGFMTEVYDFLRFVPKVGPVIGTIGAAFNWFTGLVRDQRLEFEALQAVMGETTAPMLNGRLAPLTGSGSGSSGGGSGADARKTLAQQLSEQLREQQSIQRDILRMGAEEYRIMLRRIEAVTALNAQMAMIAPPMDRVRALMGGITMQSQEDALATAFINGTAAAERFALIMPANIAGVRVMNEEFNRMTFILAQVTDATGQALGQGLSQALDVSLSALGNLAVGLNNVRDSMQALSVSLRQILVQIGVAIARAAILAGLSAAFSGTAFAGSTFGRALFSGLGIGSSTNVAVGEIRLRGSDIIAAITAEQRIGRA